ncbi:hypothetical protein [Coleofasciculus sp. E2-BRE-01]|uniref:hypothetical protein n=1 Tax=Coleofasciculus sp. E2-BRE-01 TaxID=3069524 RepID=UPI0032FCD26E
MIVAVALTLAYILSEGNSQICRTLFLLARWVYTALDKQRLLYKNLTELRRHRGLRQKGMTPVRTGSDMLSLKDIIQKLARSSSIPEWIRDFGTSSVVCLCTWFLSIGTENPLCQPLIEFDTLRFFSVR